MALTVLPKLTNPARSFIDFLVSKKILKSGFESVLSGRDFPEIDEYLLSKNLITQEDLAKEYAAFYKLPFERLVGRPIKPSVLNLLPEEIANKYEVIPYELSGPDLHLAVGEPSRLQQNAPSVLINLRRQRGLKVHLSIVPRADVEAILAKSHQNEVKIEELKPPAESAELKPITPAIAPPEVKSLNKKDLIKEVEPREKVVDLASKKIPAELLQKIPYPVAKRYQMIVFDQVASQSQFEPPMIKIAMVNTDDPKSKEILNYIEGKNKVLVDRYSTSLQSLQAALELYPEDDRQASEVKIESEQIEKKAPQTAAESKNATQEPLQPLPNEKPLSVPATHNTTPVPIPVEQTATKTEGIANRTTVVQGVTEGLTLSPDDIVSRPAVGESTADLQRLAKEQENNLESQNLDSLLRSPILSVEDLSKAFKTGVIPEIVAATLFLAIRMKASDVHLEALANAVRVRFRIDGILHDIISVPYFLHAPLISRIKILAKMKIDEQRIPQDGRFDVVIDKRQVDLRVSTLPTVHGEKIVMRLLDKSQGVLTLEQLGVTGTNFDVLITNINKPYGIIMATGPTGSGKSTTLYAILTRISKPGVNIITLEDPVEYELPGVNQSQVKPQIGFTFAEGLRSVLRQDPNIIMVGEVRDLETAAMATHAALTGHLVLTTLHTNDAAGALPRLINMGVEPFLITSSLNAVIGQRLVRKVCDKCREKVEIPHTLLETIKQELAALPSGQMKNINLDQLIFYHGRGCKECNNGYSGRIGIFEVLPMSSEVEELAVRKAPTSEIKKAAIKNGMITMIQDGLLKALKGITTVDEVMRVTTSHTKEVPGLV